MSEQNLTLESNFYLETKNKIKYFNFKKNKNNDEYLGSYFVIPIIYELDFNSELFIKNIKRFQQNKNPEYFDYTSNYVDLSQLYYHSQTKTYLMSFNWNITKKLNINFQDIYKDFESQIKLSQYFTNNVDEYGNFNILKSFVKDDEIIPIIITEDNYYELVKSEIEFNNIPKTYDVDGIEYNIWSQDNTTKEIETWEDFDNTVQLYNSIKDLEQEDLTEDEYSIKDYLEVLKVLYSELDTYFVLGDYILQIKPKQVNKLLSHTSDLYIYFENIQQVDYDDFSINPSIIDKDEMISNTTKIIYLEMDRNLWNEYKNSFKIFQEKNFLKEKMKTITSFVISSNYPTYLMKGSQPNKFYEEYFQSPFIDNISLVSIKNDNKLLPHFCDYGLIFNDLLTSSLRRLKQFIPDTVSFIIQDSFDEMRLDLVLNQYKYEEYFRQNENKKNENFGIITDKFIGEFSIDDIIKLYILPYEEKLNILINNNIPTILQKQIIYYFDKLYERMVNQNIIDINIQLEEKYETIRSYLQEHGFNTDVTQKEMYGVLKTFCKQDFFKSNKIVGLICYTSPQIDMFFYTGQTNLIKTDQLYQINLLTQYEKIQLNYSSIFYVSDDDILEYRDQYSNGLEDKSDYEVENLIYKEHFEFFEDSEKFYIPILFKINKLNKIKEYEDVNFKFSISDIQPYDYGKIITNPLFQDFDNYNKQFNPEINIEIPQLLHFVKNIEIDIPQIYSNKIIGHETYEIPISVQQEV